MLLMLLACYIRDMQRAHLHALGPRLEQLVPPQPGVASAGAQVPDVREPMKGKHEEVSAIAKAVRMLVL